MPAIIKNKQYSPPPQKKEMKYQWQEEMVLLIISFYLPLLILFLFSCSTLVIPTKVVDKM